MPVLQLDDQQFPLLAGTTRVGAGGGADVPLPADPTLGVQALIDQAEGGGGRDPLTIRRAGPAALVRVNGILLGAEPTPLMHGDRLEVGGVELRYADDTKGGATQYVNAGEMAALAGLRRAGAARATIASGGRVLSLVDGKEYAVPSAGLSFGRDATCGVVVAQNEVSRRHAEIAPDDEGYVVRDTSANGVFVNGDRVQGSQRLARADVVRVGSEEFRFYADLPAAAPAPTLAAAPAAALPAPAVASAAIPDAAPSGESSLPVLASLEALNEGPAKGTRHLLHAAFVHVGRGAHNEVHLADDSVSETHAKLQRRQDGWYVTDLASTNGTYVDGKRILGDRRLDGAPDVRFGGIKMRFTEAGFDAAAGREGRKGTRAIASAERRPGRAPSSAAAARPGADAERTTRWVWIIGAIAVGTAAFFLFKGRA